MRLLGDIIVQVGGSLDITQMRTIKINLLMTLHSRINFSNDFCRNS
jgi:hypothetical protein